MQRDLHAADASVERVLLGKWDLMRREAADSRRGRRVGMRYMTGGTMGGLIAVVCGGDTLVLRDQLSCPQTPADPCHAQS